MLANYSEIIKDKEMGASICIPGRIQQPDGIKNILFGIEISRLMHRIHNLVWKFCVSRVNLWLR